MSLRGLIADIEARTMTLTVVNTPESIAEDLRDQYEDRHLTVETRSLSEEPEQFAILSREDSFVTAVSLDDIYQPSDVDPAMETGVERSPVLDHLDETLFTSYSIEDMFMASREIEDRAWRIGTGELHAGFQTLSVLEGQTDAYNQLAEQRSLSVHTYAAPVSDSPTVPDHDDFTLHIEDDEEIKKTWFVAYDGDGVDANMCALLAEERGDEEFFGFWTYDPRTVEYVIDYLTTNYGGGESAADVDPDSDSHTV